MSTKRTPRTPEGCLQAMLEFRATKTTNEERTIDFYRETVQAVFGHMEACGCHMMPVKIKRGETEHKYGLIVEEDVVKLLKYLEENDKTVSTRRGYTRALNQYCLFFGNTVINDMRLAWPEDTRPNVDWLSMVEYKTLLEHPMNPIQSAGINLMGRMGLRRVECVRLRIKDIESGRIVVRGKGHMGGKIRLVPFHRDFEPILNRYLAHRKTIIDRAKEKNPDVEIPEELFINYTNGILRPYEEDGWGWDKAVIVPLREELGFPLLESHIEKNIRKNPMARRCADSDDSEDIGAFLDRSDDQIPRHRHGRYAFCHGEDAHLKNTIFINNSTKNNKNGVII